MKFASEEIRTKAVHAYLDGKATIKNLAEIFGYTPATIWNWIKAYRLHQQLAAKPNGHRKKCFSDKEIEELKSLLDKNVDMTLAEIKSHFNKSCCLSAIHRMLVKLGYRYKKNSQGQRTRTRRCPKETRSMATVPAKISCSKDDFS